MATTQRGTLELLQQAVSPRKDFPLELPNGDTLIYTGRKLTPGHLLNIQNTVIIKAYQKAQENVSDATDEQSSVNDNPQKARSEQDVIDSLDELVENAKYCAEVVAISLIDPETEEPIFTAKQAMELLPPDYNKEVMEWAMAGAEKQDVGEDADEVDRFPEQTASDTTEDRPVLPETSE